MNNLGVFVQSLEIMSEITAWVDSLPTKEVDIKDLTLSDTFCNVILKDDNETVLFQVEDSNIFHYVNIKDIPQKIIDLL